MYSGHGFEVAPTYRFLSSVGPAGTIRKRRLDPIARAEDAALFGELLRERTAVSQECSSADDGWMVGIVAALSGRLQTGMWWLPDHQAIVVFDGDDEHNLLVEVFARELPDPAILRAAAPKPELPMLYSFCPDLIDEGAVAQPAPASIGSMMIRGQWPGPAVFGVSPLWEH